MSTLEFNTLLGTLNANLMSFAFKLTKTKEDAEDLFQETTIRALSNKEKFRPGTNFKAWMFTIMKNIFINQYRKNQKANTVIDRSENLFLINSGKTTVYNEANTNLTLEELQGFVEDLDEGLKTPFTMHFEGYKYQEISDKLLLPLGTIKSRIFFARKALKQKIKSRYGDLETILIKLGTI